MNTVMRGIGLAFLVGASLVLSGCSTDNESEADKLQAKLGPAPKSDAKSDAPSEPPPASIQDYAKRHQALESVDKKNSEYAKAAKGGASR